MINRRAACAMSANLSRYRAIRPEEHRHREFRNEYFHQLLRSPARDFLPQQFAKFGNSAVRVGEMLGPSGLRTALRFKNDAILLDHLPVLLLQKCLEEKPPIRFFQSMELPIPQKIDEGRVVVDRCGKTKDSQNTFRTERQGNVEPHPERITAVKFRPIEVHSALP